jgi:hypothetical protein
MRRLTLVAVLLMTGACRHGSPAAPTPPTSTSTQSTQPSSSSVALSGAVTAMSGDAVTGAKLTILDGPYAGRWTTSIDGGDYRFENLTPGNVNVSAIADGYLESRSGVFVNGINTLKFALESAGGCFAKSGVGNATFHLPDSVTHVHILATYHGQYQSFVVRIGGQQIVYEIIGECDNPGQPMVYDDTVTVTNNGAIEIVDSDGVSWTIAEDGDQCASQPAKQLRHATARARR